MKDLCNFITVLLVLLAAISCEGSLSSDKPGSKPNGTSIKVNVPETEAFIMTKAGDASSVPTRVFGSEDDGFTISEYVRTIDEAMAQLATKGTEMTTTGINKPGESFIVDGYGKVSPGPGEDPVMTNHLPGLTASYTSSGTNHWPWSGADPKWINESNLHIWSYYPVGAISPDITVNDTSPYTGNTAAFTSYTTDNTDLLLAYNREFREFEKNALGQHDYNTDGAITNDIIGSDAFNVKFYHALAAVKFELSSTTSGADIHSITLCYVNSSKQIVATGEGIATTGDCVATGSGSGSGTVTFDWSNLDNRKALHYEFDSSHSVAGGYTSTGAGVLFMIPQEASDLSIIVEFSKNGSTQYYTRIVDFPDVSWEAGYYYTYKLSIGEFHVPGEKMTQLTDVHIQGLKNNSGGAFLRPDTAIPIKGVTKMGLATTGYGLGSKSGQTVYMYCNKDGSSNTIPGPGSGFQFDFDPVTKINDNIYSFGNGTSETYDRIYTFSITQSQTKNPASNGVPGFYAFDTTGINTFQLYFMPSAGDNSGGFHAFLIGLFVLEVEKDANLPNNFPLTTWP